MRLLVCTLRPLFLASLVLLPFGLGRGDSTTTPGTVTTPPRWYLEHVEFLTREGGRWITDNSEYVSEEELDDEYGIEWVAAPGGAAMTGRLFGLRDGVETQEYWRFCEYWDPAEGRAVASQFGNGRMGSGTLEPTEEGETSLDQTFHTFAGARSRVGHRSRHPDEDTHVTESFAIDDEGTWTPNRSYTWDRVPAPSAGRGPGQDSHEAELR